MAMYFELREEPKSTILEPVAADQVTITYDTYREVLRLPHLKGRVVYGGRVMADGRYLVESSVMRHA